MPSSSDPKVSATRGSSHWQSAVEILCYCATSTLTAALWLTYSPVEDLARARYGWGRRVVPSLAVWGPAVSLALSPLTPRVVRSVGTRGTTTLAAVFVAAAAAARCISTARLASIVLAHASCGCNALGGALVLATPSLVSRDFFDERHRIMATSAMLAANQLGACLGFLGARVARRPGRLGRLLSLEAIAAAAVLACCLARHRIWTSAAGDNDDDEDDDDERDGGRGLVATTPTTPTPTKRRSALGELLASRRFVTLATALGCSMGAFTGWQGVLFPLLRPLGWSEREASWLGFASGVGAVIAQLGAGACLLGASAATTRRATLATLAGAAASFAAFAALVVSRTPGNGARLAAVFALSAGAFLVVAAEGIVYEAARAAVPRSAAAAAGAGLVVSFNVPMTAMIVAATLGASPSALTCSLVFSTAAATALLAAVWRQEPPLGRLDPSCNTALLPAAAHG